MTALLYEHAGRVVVDDVISAAAAEAAAAVAVCYGIIGNAPQQPPRGTTSFYFGFIPLRRSPCDSATISRTRHVRVTRR